MDILRIILALLLTPAYLLADENVNLKNENDDAVEEEVKENDKLRQILKKIMKKNS